MENFEFKSMDIIIDVAGEVFVVIEQDGKLNVVSEKYNNFGSISDIPLYDVKQVYRPIVKHYNGDDFSMCAFHHIIRDGFDVDYTDHYSFEKVYDEDDCDKEIIPEFQIGDRVKIDWEQSRYIRSEDDEYSDYGTILNVKPVKRKDGKLTHYAYIVDTGKKQNRYPLFRLCFFEEELTKISVYGHIDCDAKDCGLEITDFELDDDCWDELENDYGWYSTWEDDDY